MQSMVKNNTYFLAIVRFDALILEMIPNLDQ